MSATACSMAPRALATRPPGSVVTASTAAPATPPTSPPTIAAGIMTIRQSGPPMVHSSPAEALADIAPMPAPPAAPTIAPSA
jgi:hypothetical protein